MAIGISDEVRSALARMQQELARCPAKVRWVPPENLHLTLRFLGEIDEGTAGRVEAALAGLAGGGPVEFAVTGLGCFPPRGRPRVLWAGVSRGAEAVSALEAAVDQALRPLGFRSERRFVPHLTIGRVKSPRGAEALAPLVAARAGTEFGSCTASEVTLFESILAPRGAVYRARARAAL